MSKRDLFKDMKGCEGKDNERKEYTPPQEDMGFKIAERLFERYVMNSDKYIRYHRLHYNLESEVGYLESIMEKQADKLNPKIILDSLIIRIGEIVDAKHSDYATEYLEAVIQALFNLNLTDEFEIDISDWPNGPYFSSYSIGMYLKGRSDRPLILYLCGEYYQSGYFARDCIFCLMPGAKIDHFFDAQPFRNNILKNMNEKGEWETVPPESLRR